MTSYKNEYQHYFISRDILYHDFSKAKVKWQTKQARRIFGHFWRLLRMINKEKN